MRSAKVPIDMTSEQKEILGILSKRQLMYLVGGGLILYYYIPLVFKMLSGAGWIVASITALCTAAPTLAIIFFLGFDKVDKFKMNRDYYYLIKLKRKTQYGSWRKGQ